MTTFMLSTVSVLEHVTGANTVMSGACTALCTRHTFREIRTNSPHLCFEKNTEFS